MLMPESDSGSVRGAVLRPDGIPIKGTTVQLFDAAGQPFEHAISNSVGRFSFPRVPAGSYLIVASEPGFQIPGRIPVSVIRNRTTTVNIKMQRSSCCSNRKRR